MLSEKKGRKKERKKILIKIGRNTKFFISRPFENCKNFVQLISSFSCWRNGRSILYFNEYGTFTALSLSKKHDIILFITQKFTAIRLKTTLVGQTPFYW